MVNCFDHISRRGIWQVPMYTGGMTRRAPILAFLLSAALLGIVFATPTFGDADAYYHLWMAKRIAAAGPVLRFGWLPFTTLAAHFADQHFLYHLALIPFLKLLGDFWGLKIATVLFAALAFAALAVLFEAYGLRRAFLWTLPLLFAPGFLFRLLLTKSTALALVALFLFLTALKKEHRRALFAVSFLYVWLHAGWPILIGVALIDAIIRRSAKFLPPVFLGLALGLVFNPFFPQNLSFYWEQIVQMAVVGAHAFGVVVGNEWYPVDLGTLLLENPSVFLPLLAAVALAAVAVLKSLPARAEAVPAARRRDIVFVSSLAIVFLLMTLRQARHKEYFLPLALFASALLFESACAAVDVRALSSAAASKLGRAWKPLLAAAALVLTVFGGYEASIVQKLYAGRNAWTRFAAAGAWMRARLPAEAVVFHTAWDDFPYLLYRDDAQRYIVGLDPRFLADQDLAKYWEWRDISEGRRRVGLAGLLEKDFGARYVFLRRDDEPLRPLMKKDPSFERVYQDSEAEIWAVR